MSKVILFLYSEVGPYNIPVMSSLKNDFGFDVHVVRWDKNCLKPYKPPLIDGIHFYNKSEYGLKRLLELVDRLDPSLIYVSGWMDKQYLKVCLKYKNKGVSIVSGFDDIWINSLRQKLGSVYFKNYLHRYFSHAWVAGEPQYEFARRLGFQRNKIIFDLLSGDTEKFRQGAKSRNNVKTESRRNFLYVGNFRLVKGIDILVQAFHIYKNDLKGKWNLICIGNGECKPLLENQHGIILFDYVLQDKLIEYAKQASCLILPSRHDQWGVVVHEFAALGLSLLLSEGVGAKSKFLINGYNGYCFKSNSASELAQAMYKVSTLSDDKLTELSNNSVIISERISPRTSAANLVSLLDEC